MDLKNCILNRLFFPKEIPEKDTLTYVIGEFISHHTRKTFTGLGNIINPAIGMEYNLVNGEWKENIYRGSKNFQFMFEYAKHDNPSNEKGIAMYLTKYIDGIGVETAARIINKYGIESIETLKNSPSRVSVEIKGISKKKAHEISDKLIELEKLETIYIELEGLLGDVKGLPKKTIPELISRYGFKAFDVLKLNPYILTAINGIGFLLADRVALEKLSIQPDSIFRQKAGIEYALKQELSKGGTWGSLQSILNDAKQLIDNNVLPGFNELISDNVLTQKADNYVWFITFNHYNNYEIDIAKKVMMLCNNTQEKNVQNYKAVGE